METYHRRRKTTHWEPHSQRRRWWCCTFPLPTAPAIFTTIHNGKLHHRKAKPDPHYSKPKRNSVLNSPMSSKPGLSIVGRIDPRRILSPGRVSPIDSHHAFNRTQETALKPAPSVYPSPKSRSKHFPSPTTKISGLSQVSGSVAGSGSGGERDMDDCYDARLSLRGKHGGVLVLELSSGVLAANSGVFAALIEEHKGGSDSSSASKKMCRIEVPEVENLGVYRQTIEFMFEDGDNITKKLLDMGVCRAIDLLEVSAGIKFTKGVFLCLKYLEAVPWTEEEEEKLRSLFTIYKFDDATSGDILARLYSVDSVNCQQGLARQFVLSITTCTDFNARNQLKSLVKGLLCKTKVYEKEQPVLKKEDIFVVCQSCLDLLVNLFEEASGIKSLTGVLKKEKDKPLIERICTQVDNLNWLIEILLDWQIAEDFVDLWAEQGELVKMHESSSSIVRYELSRVSATLFIAMGNRNLHCRSESRSGLVQAWFGPMLVDFGWLQRCKKGLDMRTLETSLGETLLTLPLKQQYTFFIEWFEVFSKQGTECPNLSKAFQIWWRRSFLKGSET